ncbi:MAG: mechanosensitive ion channel family protein [Rhodothermaceae bacterium]|nr:mechanosensitive ion channel family protein [Rhodothermaceae bacterium]
MDTFLSGIAERLRTIFDPEILGASSAELFANLIVGLATFAAFYLLWRLLDLIARPLLRKRLDATTRVFVERMIKIVVLTFGLVQALASVGIETGAVIASLGIAGLTIGFAAQDALSNLISGILIFWDRPFVIGDLVEVGEHYGRVEKITLRSTRVVTPDGRMLAVPNAEIINSTVASYTNFPHLRLDIPVTINVSENIGHVRSVLLGLVQSDEYLDEPPPAVVVTALNDYNVELELRVWIADERQHIPMRLALREAMFDALNAAGVDMPFETLRLEPMEVLTRSAAP